MIEDKPWWYWLLVFGGMFFQVGRDRFCTAVSSDLDEYYQCLGVRR